MGSQVLRIGGADGPAGYEMEVRMSTHPWTGISSGTTVYVKRPEEGEKAKRPAPRLQLPYCAAQQLGNLARKGGGAKTVLSGGCKCFLSRSLQATASRCDPQFPESLLALCLTASHSLAPGSCPRDNGSAGLHEAVAQGSAAYPDVGVITAAASASPQMGGQVSISVERSAVRCRSDTVGAEPPPCALGEAMFPDEPVKGRREYCGMVESRLCSPRFSWQYPRQTKCPWLKMVKREARSLALHQRSC
ncbi:hypothetical protein P4O66_007382 [Electrophorus voltai]|uniref:Uncharacterized protein n=1 Tax=Electrophorus voltai TaxID=2609070 RepID=A0AAD8ZGP9_9TELE|nr:hypothetical protein P4O66_007382 [Electrophorus voltai]